MPSHRTRQSYEHGIVGRFLDKSPGLEGLTSVLDVRGTINYKGDVAGHEFFSNRRADAVLQEHVQDNDVRLNKGQNLSCTNATWLRGYRKSGLFKGRLNVNDDHRLVLNNKC